MKGLKQSEIAKIIGVDTSRISRIETGQVVPDIDEIRRITAAIGTPEALAYPEFSESVWVEVEKPGFWHPSREHLATAENLLAKLEEFAARPVTTDAAKAQANLHRESLKSAVSFLADTNHSISFVGEIGVGKSTAICGITGMLLPPDPKAPAALSKRVVLETGAGRVTLCEVHLRSEGKDSFGLVVSPHSEEEVFRCVSDFCASLVDDLKGQESSVSGDSEKRGVPEEMNKALRNMAKLARRTIPGPDGKPSYLNPAMELAKACNGNLPELTAEVLKRMRLDQRTTTEFRFETDDLVAGMRRLQELFAGVNKGLLDDVSLPRRVDMIVPIQLLGNRPFSVRVIDTRGIADTAIRPDIRCYLDDPRTVTVLCSRFGNAPDNSLKLLMENLASTGAERTLAERVVVLVLARAQEVLDIQDDAGNRAETAEEGYRIKGEQVHWALSQVSGARELPVHFLDVVNDDRVAVVEQLAGAITKLRDLHAKRIGEIGKAIDELIQRHGEEQTKAAQEKVRKRLRIFIGQHLLMEAPQSSVYGSMVSAYKTTHHMTVWASTTRNGAGSGLDAYHWIGIGTAMDVQKRSQPQFSGLNELLGNMLGDPELEPAKDYLNELRRTVPTWRERFLSEARVSGREIFRAELFVDDSVWRQCVRLSGQGGGGYRRCNSLSVIPILPFWSVAEKRQNRMA
jgi:transcriptional regulator with XRE-family HTH domain